MSYYGGCNTNPDAQNDCVSIDYNTAVVISVLANDTDKDGDKLTVVSASDPEHGSVVINADGTVTFTPDAGFFGTTSFSYKISDGHGGYDTATVTVTVCEPENDGIVSGTADSDLIDYDYTGDPDGDRIDHNDAILPGESGNDDIVEAGAGNDTVYAGAGDDEVYGGDGDDSLFGGSGNDSIDGGAGNDVIHGDGGGGGTPCTTEELTLDWADFGKAGCSIPTGTSVDLGGVTATFAFQVQDPGATAKVTNELQYVEAGDGLDPTTGLKLYGCGGEGGIDNTSTTTISFAADDGTGAGAVQNVSFRINDIDQGPSGDYHRDIVTIHAYDADGNEIPVTLTSEGGVSVSGNTATGQAVDTGCNDQTATAPSGSVLVEIAGPVSRIVIDYDNGGYSDQSIYVTDLTLETVPHDDLAEGNDTLLGGDGDDEIYGDGGDDLVDGGTGDDTIIGGAGADTLSGGYDSDTFIVGSAEDGIGDVIDGGEDPDDGDWDVLDLSAVGKDRLSITYTSPDKENGTVTFLDDYGNPVGSLIFANIENIVPCFTPGTRIATPRGERLVEDLRVGDKIFTRDNGIQELRWIGRRDLNRSELNAAPHLKPILIRAGSLGDGMPERDMLVSPNHRMLVSSERTALYFEEHEVLVAAKHLIDNHGVRQAETLGTSYLHFMFDRHEIVLANGSWTESFQPGDRTLSGMGNSQRSEIFELFPELKTTQGIEGYGAARKTLKRHEAVLLTLH